MREIDWIKEYPAAIKACRADGTLLFLNDVAAKNAAGAGGRTLVGHSIFPLHKPASQEKLKKLIETGGTNCYTIEKNGVKSLVYQAPWFATGKVMGMVEITIELPPELPHYVR